jgi:hypothetical protein
LDEIVGHRTQDKVDIEICAIVSSEHCLPGGQVHLPLRNGHCGGVLAAECHPIWNIHSQPVAGAAALFGEFVFVRSIF